MNIFPRDHSIRTMTKYLRNSRYHHFSEIDSQSMRSTEMILEEKRHLQSKSNACTPREWIALSAIRRMIFSPLLCTIFLVFLRVVRINCSLAHRWPKWLAIFYRASLQHIRHFTSQFYSNKKNSLTCGFFSTSTAELQEKYLKRKGRERRRGENLFVECFLLRDDRCKCHEEEKSSSCLLECRLKLKEMLSVKLVEDRTELREVLLKATLEECMS